MQKSLGGMVVAGRFLRPFLSPFQSGRARVRRKRANLMSRNKNRYSLQAILFFLLAWVGILNLYGAGKVIADSPTPTGGATETPLPLSSLYPTLTLTPQPDQSPIVVASRTPARARSLPRTPFPTDTKTPIPLVQANPTVVQAGALLTQEITLAALNVHNLTDLSSGDSVQFTFQLPDNWVPGGNNFLNLNFDYFATSGGNQTISTPLTAILRVQFDSELAASFMLSNTGGKQNLNVPLRLGLLGNPTRHTHAVRVTLDTSENCQVSQTA